MVELWQFIFSSFWVWLGTLILVCGALGTLRLVHVNINKNDSAPPPAEGSGT